MKHLILEPKVQSVKVWHLYGKVPQESFAKKSAIKIQIVVYVLTFYTVAEGQKNPTQHIDYSLAIGMKEN